jgi:hypothetical protein
MIPSITRNCYLCNKPLDDADYCAIEVRHRDDVPKTETVGVHDECIKTHNRNLSREAFLRATNRRVQSKSL